MKINVFCTWKEGSFAFNIFSLKGLTWECLAVLTLCFLNQLCVYCRKINRHCTIMKKSSFILPNSMRVLYFQSRVLYIWAIDKEGRGLSWGFLTAGRVHFRPFVTAVISPEIPYAKVMFWLFYSLLFIYFLKPWWKVVVLALSHQPNPLSRVSFGTPWGGSNVQ
jgi:hypothetical protein